MNILVVGSGARELAIIRALARSSSQPNLFCFGTTKNPGIVLLCKHIRYARTFACADIVKQAQEWHIDLVIVGPEATLAQGLADQLLEQGIPTVGPKKSMARIESSKTFTRNLLHKYHILGSPRYRAFTDLGGVRSFLHELGEDQYVIKADGLMGGKGVKVSGDHFHSIEEAYQFCSLLCAQNSPFLIEEKLIGQEFSFLCFADGRSLIPMPLVQDFKRAFVGDKGPNTGGMGSYSDVNHSLPFLTTSDVNAALKINQAVFEALQEECNDTYRGILYGGFMVTNSGVKLIEYNARFGDPEALNILSILESDFTEICHNLALGQLSQQQVRFKALATVCKYAVPLGYPNQDPTIGTIDISQVKDIDSIYYAHVEEVDGALMTKGSRSIAVVGIAPTLHEAEAIAETKISQIQGPVFHREDIGKAEVIAQRINMMNELRQEHASI